MLRHFKSISNVKSFKMSLFSIFFKCPYSSNVKTSNVQSDLSRLCRLAWQATQKSIKNIPDNKKNVHTASTSLIWIEDLFWTIPLMSNCSDTLAYHRSNFQTCLRYVWTTSIHIYSLISWLNLFCIFFHRKLWCHQSTHFHVLT